MFWAALAALTLWLRWPYLAPDMIHMDEGIMFTAGKILASGGTLYSDVFEYKPPLSFFIWSTSIRLFGADATPVQILVTLSHLMVAWTVFRLGATATGNIAAGRIGAVIYIVSTHTLAWFNVMVANTEILCLTFLCPALLLVLAFLDPKEREGDFGLSLIRLAVAGMLIGFAAMVALPAALTGPICFVCLALVWLKRQDTRKLILAGGAALVVGCAVSLWLCLKVLPVDLDGFRLTFDMADVSLRQWRHVDGLTRWQLFGFVHGALLVRHTLIWIAGLAGVLLLTRRLNPSSILLLLMAAWGLWFVNLTGRYFGHYYLLLYPFLAALSGTAIILAMKQAGRQAVVMNVVGIALVAGLAFPLINTFIYHMTSEDEAYFTTRRFPDDLQVGLAKSPGLWLKAHTTEEDNILVLNGHSQVYAYADRRPASRFVMLDPSYLYFSEDQSDRRVVEKVRDLLRRDTQNSRPKYVLELESGRLFEDRTQDPPLRGDPLGEWFAENYILDSRVFPGYRVWRLND